MPLLVRTRILIAILIASLNFARYIVEGQEAEDSVS